MFIFEFINALGATVVMPIVICILGLIMGAGFGKSLRSGLMVAVGFIGLNLVIGAMGSGLGPAVQDMVARFGLSLSIIDVGWPAAAAIAMGTTVGLMIIPIGLVTNVIMLLTNTTQTMNIDIWNYWHFAFTGSIVAAITGNIGLGIAAAVINMVIVMVIADFTAPGVEQTLGLPGISIPHGFSGAFVPVAWVVDKVISLIPGVRDWDINLEKIQKRFGVLGEPILIGTVIGIIIGAMAGYGVVPDAAGHPGFLALGVSMGAVLVLVPKMAALLMEGLLPISDASSAFIQKHFSSRGKIYIGLDSAVGTGHPISLAVALILVPVTIFLAVVLPGNNVLPFVDLAVMPYMFVLIIPLVKGNGFRALVTGVIVVATGLLIATNFAPDITTVAQSVNFAMPAGATYISSICDGANPLSWIIARLAGFSYAGVGISGAIAVALAVINRMRIVKEAKALRETV